MKSNDEDLFKPLSAKVGRKQYASNGRERDGSYARSGDAQKVRAALKRRAQDAARRGKGALA